MSNISSVSHYAISNSKDNTFTYNLQSKSQSQTPLTLSNIPSNNETINLNTVKDNFNQSRFKWISERDKHNHNDMMNLDLSSNNNTSFNANIGHINNKIELLNKDYDVKKEYYINKLQDETLNITIDNSSHQINNNINHRDY